MYKESLCTTPWEKGNILRASARARVIASYNIIIAFAEIELSRYINLNTEYITFRIVI